MRQNNGEMVYPVPWSTEGSTSKLSTPAQYKQAMTKAGFKISKESNRRDFSLDFFAQQRARTEANGGPPPLGLHTLMQESTSNKIKNMVDNIVNDLIAPVEIIVQKGWLEIACA